MHFKVTPIFCQYNGSKNFKLDVGSAIILLCFIIIFKNLYHHWIPETFLNGACFEGNGSSIITILIFNFYCFFSKFIQEVKMSKKGGAVTNSKKKVGHYL